MASLRSPPRDPLRPSASRPFAARALSLLGLAGAFLALAAVWPGEVTGSPIDDDALDGMPASFVATGAHHAPDPARVQLDQLEALISLAEADNTDRDALIADAALLWAEADDPELGEEAFSLLIDVGTRSWPSDYRGRFLRRLAPEAVRLGRVHQLLPSVSLAQAILESGWGRSSLAEEHNNLFGIKAGRSTEAVRLSTREHVSGRARQVVQRFRTFDSWGESLEHHARLLSRDSRYADARPSWQDPAAYLAAIAPTYASNPRYAETLLDIVERYELDRFDRAVVLVVEAEESATADADGDTGLTPG